MDIKSPTVLFATRTPQHHHAHFHLDVGSILQTVISRSATRTSRFTHKQFMFTTVPQEQHPRTDVHDAQDLAVELQNRTCLPRRTWYMPPLKMTTVSDRAKQCCAIQHEFGTCQSQRTWNMVSGRFLIVFLQDRSSHVRRPIRRFIWTFFSSRYTSQIFIVFHHKRLLPCLALNVFSACCLVRCSLR